MKIKHFLIAAVVVLALVCVYAAGTKDAATELKDLLARVNGKIGAGQRTEAQLAPELKEFDALLAEHKDEKTDAVARILLFKAMLYAEVFQNQSKANELLEQLKKDYPGTQTVAELKKREESQTAIEKMQRTLVAGATFPDFNEKDIDGKPLSIANYKGKVVLVDFWATWCGPCVGEMPEVVKTYQRHHAQGFEIIGISLDETLARVTSFTKDHGMTWQQFFDGQVWNNKLAVKYGINSIPATFLLDGDGKIIGKDFRGGELEAAVGKAVSKK